MTREVVITVHIAIPDDASFAEALAPGPEIPDEEIDSLAAQPIAGTFARAAAAFVPQQIMPPNPLPPNPQCVTHHTSKFVPAGTSKKTGKPYKAFWGCTEMGCKWTQDAAE